MILKYIYHRTDEYDYVIFEGYYVANSDLHAYKIQANFIHIRLATSMRAGISTVTTGHQNKITTATAIPASQHVQGESYLTSLWNLNTTIIVFTDDTIQK